MCVHSEKFPEICQLDPSSSIEPPFRACILEDRQAHWTVGTWTECGTHRYNGEPSPSSANASDFSAVMPSRSHCAIFLRLRT